jgi:hypothetical protein
MSKDSNLSAKIITITSMSNFDYLLSNGYEISAINLNWSASEQSMLPTLLLVKGNERLLADATQISEYVVQLQPLYDVNKKKNGFIWVPNTTLYFHLEQKFIDIALGDHGCPLRTEKLNMKNPELVYETLLNLIKNSIGVKFKKTDLSQIFYSVYVINIQGENVIPKSYSKDSLDVVTIQQLIHSSKNYDSSLAMSFIVLSEKNPHPREMLVGFIMYDLKTNNTICFNIQSLVSFAIQNSIENEQLDILIAKLAMSLFNKSCNRKMECKSHLPLPIYTEWYTPLPWLTYLALNPIQIKSRVVPEQRNISIPEFLAFGYPEDYKSENTFHFKPFSSGTQGHAACILKFNDGNKSLKYNLRFDQSSGEPLLHLDYSIYGAGQEKLIAHYPIDLEMIYQFSPDLFVAILAAGMCDGHFSTIIERGLKGIAELIARNPAYFYPFKQILLLEKAIDWFDENPQRYQILEKVSSGEELTKEEKDVVEYIRNNFIGIVATENGRQGIGFMGDAILFRRDRNQINVRVNK